MLSTSITAYTRSYLSIYFIKSAPFFARKAFEIESLDNDKIDQRTKDNHKSYVLSSIISSVTFLEASINELFSDYSEELYIPFGKLNNDRQTLFAKMWKRGIPRTAKFSILEKYQIALDLANLQAFNAGHQPYQDVDSLIKLRNVLIHYEPEFLAPDFTPATNQKEQHKFEQALGGKFEENPLAGQGRPFYTDRCLGHGCAEWGVKSCLKFTNTFFNKLDIKPLYTNGSVEPFLETR